MESSLFGRPNMEAVLDDSFKPAGNSRSWSSCDYEGLMAECDEGNENNNNTNTNNAGRNKEGLGESGDIYDSPLTLARVAAAAAAADNASPKLVRPDGGELSLSRSHGKANSDDDDDDDRDFNTTTTMSDNCNLFVPELMYQLDASDDGKPPMPDLPISAFPRGTSVWVTDVSHVMMQMGDAWDHGTRDVCNGQAKGVVVRIVTEDLLFVRFEDEANEMVRCHTLPRRCLSTSPIEPYPLPDDVRSVGALGGSFGCIGGLKPRAGRGPANAGKDRKQRDGGSDEKEGSREKDDRENCVLQQYCEVVDAGTPSRRTEAAWNMFLKKRFKDCIAELNEIYEKAKADSMDSLTLNEILTWRSFAYFFNKDYDKSLADALQTIENSTSWVRGYVRAARAYTGLGQISRAIEMMTHAGKLLPKSSEVADTLRMLGYLKKIQAKVDVYGLRYFLDPSYAKRLQATRAFQRGEVILEDDAIIVGCPSVENEGTFCCEVCLTPTQNLVQVGSRASSSSSLSSLSSASLAGSPPPMRKNTTDGQQCSSGNTSVRLCGPRCEAIGRNFLVIETGTGGKACAFAEQLLLNKAANSADVLAIERARLAMRLFYLAYYRHSRMHKHRHDHKKQNRSGDINNHHQRSPPPQGQGDAGTLGHSHGSNSPLNSLGGHLSPNSAAAAASLRSAHPTVREVLAAIGVFPIPSLELDAKTRGDVEALHTVVSSFMTPEEKQVYDRDLFVLAYNYAVNYAFRISGGVDDRGRLISGLVIANTASCLERWEPTGTASASNSMTVNCEVRLVGPSRVAVVATCDINVGDRLAMHAPKKGRY